RLPEKLRHIMPVIAAGILALSPAILEGIPRGPDLWHHYRVALPFYDSIRNGTLYPGWNWEATGGYGDISFRFYTPAVYCALAIARLLIGNWYDASLLIFVLLSVTGGLGVYLWARTLLPGRLAVWAGIFYTFVPYHVNELFQSFLLPEYAAGAVLPFSFAFTELVSSRGRLRDVIGLSVSYAALVLTHLPLAVIGSLSLLVYALLTVQREKRWQTLVRLSLGPGLGLVASA